jgi:cardiolipin synthase
MVGASSVATRPSWLSRRNVGLCAAGGAVLGGSVAAATASGMQTVAQHCLPHGSSFALLNAGLALAVGVGVGTGAWHSGHGTAGRHTELLVARHATQMAGRLQGAAIGSVAGYAVGSAVAGSMLGWPLAVVGGWLGSRIGGGAASGVTSLGEVGFKRWAGMAGSFFSAPARPIETDPHIEPVRSTFTPLVDDKSMIADVMREVAAAQHSIHFESFLFNGPDAKALCDLLIEKKRQGLEVKVLLDPTAQTFEERHRAHSSNHHLAQYLRQNGVDVALYPVNKLSGSLTPAEHAKLLVIDDRMAYMGGTNIDEADNHDVNVKICGPAARDIRELFDESWDVSQQSSAFAVGRAQDPTIRDPFVQVYSTGPSRSTIKQAVLEHIDAARQEVKVEMFALSDREIIEALKRAHRRGVNVQVLLCENRRAFGLPTFHLPNLPAALELQEAGIDVRLYHREQFHQMHTKMAIFDRHTVVLGSVNWIHNAFRGVHEYCVSIVNDELAGQLIDQFHRDQTEGGRAVANPNAAMRVLGTTARLVAPVLL